MLNKKHARAHSPKSSSRTRIEDLAAAPTELPDAELTAVSGAMMDAKKVSWTSGGKADEWVF